MSLCDFLVTLETCSKCLIGKRLWRKFVGTTCQLYPVLNAKETSTNECWMRKKARKNSSKQEWWPSKNKWVLNDKKTMKKLSYAINDSCHWWCIYQLLSKIKRKIACRWKKTNKKRSTYNFGEWPKLVHLLSSTAQVLYIRCWQGSVVHSDYVMSHAIATHLLLVSTSEHSHSLDN